MRDPTGDVTELLRQLIRNGCVNDGTVESGREVRSADVIAGLLEGAGLEVARFEPAPGRASVVARIDGTDPAAPSLAYVAHLDVVPVNPSGWREDPFGGELIDGVVWGRGAVDMLGTTASMAIAVRRLIASGFRPRGTLVFVACADEEALGTWGSQWLTERETDAVRTDYVITEFGGMRFPGDPARPRMPVMAGEKGTYWCRLRVRGTPGHASMPHRTDNAVVKAAEVVRRLAGFRPPPRMHELWRRFVDGIEMPEEMREVMLDPARFDEWCDQMPVGLGRMLHACTHTTVAPTIARGGTKTNIIPAEAEVQLDVRTLPGQTGAEARAMLLDALGDLARDVEIVEENPSEASASAVETPLWDVLNTVTGALVPGARTVPFLTVGATDARFFRRLGAVAYGYGLLSERIPIQDFMQMFHGDNERIDQESLRLSTELWTAVAREFLA